MAAPSRADPLRTEGQHLAGNGQRKSGAQDGFYNHFIIDYKSL